MDNRKLHFVGKTREQLNKALDLFLSNEYGSSTSIIGYYINPENGFVLCHSMYRSNADPEITPFTNRLGVQTPINNIDLTNVLWEWITNVNYNDFVYLEFESKFEDSDVSFDKGWSLYSNKWGHINNGIHMHHGAVLAFKPTWLWYGK